MDISETVTTWVRDLEAALVTGDAVAVGALIATDGWWRDQLVTDWDLRTIQGRDTIVGYLKDRLPGAEVRSLALDPGYEPQLVEGPGGRTWIQAIMAVELGRGRGSAVVRLVREGEAWLAWTFFVRLQELAGHEPAVGHHRPRGVQHGGHRSQVSWQERREREREFLDTEPEVLVVGGGQSGLSLAAELGRIGMSALVVEANPRIGDNWRRRYKSLVLHDPVYANHLPYLPFPDTWPVFTPKDKFGDWLETYVSVLDLDVWTSTRFGGAEYDEEERRWTVELTRADGSTRTLHPRHVVLATGVSGLPTSPVIEGQELFTGQVLHSSAFGDAEDFRDQKVVIVGASNSAHDIAHDLAENGVEVTMVQRSATQVASSRNLFDVLFEGLYGEDEISVDRADLLAASLPLPVLFDLQREGVVPEVSRRDAEMIEGLKAAGFRFDPTGLQELFYSRGGGYYIDVGAAAAIIDGRISVRGGVEVSRFTESGVVYSDGTEEAADSVVLATGYGNVREVIGELFGEEVRERCSDVWGLDEQGELRSVWRHSGQDGLWVMGGNLFLVRQYARVLALQLKAAELGLS